MVCRCMREVSGVGGERGKCVKSRERERPMNKGRETELPKTEV